MSALPNVTALPSPRYSPQSHSPGRLGPGAADLLKAPLRWLGRSNASWQALNASHQRARQNARARRAAAKSQPVVLGSAAQPWVPDDASTATLESLSSFGGLEIHITTKSPLVLQNLPTLTDLDRDHAIQVDVVVSGPDLRARGVREGLGVVRRLAAEGIATRILLAAREIAGADGRRISAGRFFAAAHQAGATDVRSTSRRRDEREETRFERLRLQHGFPLAQLGRG